MGTFNIKGIINYPSPIKIEPQTKISHPTPYLEGEESPSPTVTKAEPINGLCEPSRDPNGR